MTYLRTNDNKDVTFGTDGDLVLAQCGVWWKHFLAGATAGTISRTVTAPLDRIKIYAQVHGKKVKILNGLKFLVSEGGFLSLWRGNGINVIKIAPETASKFLAYEEAKQIIQQGDATYSLTLKDRFLSGAIAGGIAQTFVYPVEVIKTRRAIVSSVDPPSILDICKKGISKHGWGFFVRGYFCNIIGIILFTGIDLTIYETIKSRCIVWSVKEKPKNVCLLLSATTSCVVAQMFTYPFSMVGTALQATDDTNMSSQVMSCYHIMSQRLKKCGIVGLYRGCVPSLVKAVPALCITYFVYENVLRRLGTEMT